MVDDPGRRGYFSKRLLEPRAWFHNANRLTLAMSLIAPSIERYWEIMQEQFLREDEGFSEKTPEYDCHLIFMMLAGYAIENLCKGFLIKQLTDEELVAAKNGKYPSRLANHNVQELVKWTGLDIDASEENLLTRVQAAAIWRARYPVPKSDENILPAAQLGSDVRRINEFLQKLRRHVGAKSSYQGAI